MSAEKIAIVFPGIGYHKDKPLLYYARKVLRSRGYSELCIDYDPMPGKVRGNEKLLRECCDIALASAEKQLKSFDAFRYEDIVLVCKSIGTAAGARFINAHNISARGIWFTPIPEFFESDPTRGILFHGTADPWAENDVIIHGCQRNKEIVLAEIPRADHSLECGDAIGDLRILQNVITQTAAYIDTDL